MKSGLFELSISARLSNDARHAINFSCLDLPRNGQLFEGKVIFSGWVLKSNNVNTAKVIVENGDNRYVIGLDVVRRDVLSKVLNVADSQLEQHELLCCGFSSEVEIDKGFPVKIYFVADEIEYLWTSISLKESSFDSSAFRRLWQNFLQNDFSRQDAKEISQAMSVLGQETINSLLFDSAQVVNVKAFCEGDVAVLPKAKRFIDHISTNDFCCHAIETCLSQGAVIVPDPLGYGVALCRESYSFNNNINILGFKSATGERFFVFQHVSSADAVYFPTRNCVVVLKHLSVESIKSCVFFMLKNAERLAEYASHQNSFGGLITSHGRPYHFYYDVAPAVSDLKHSGLLGKVRNLFYYEGGDFCSFKDMYSLSVEEYVVKPGQLWERMSNEKSFCFHVGNLFDAKYLESTSRFDREFLAHARAVADYGQDDISTNMRSCYPLIWFGVTVQKRSWIEQVDAAVSIFESLHKEYPNLGVVFDGWTSPLHATAADRRETENDLAVCKQIVDKTSCAIKFFSLVGRTSQQKVAYARLVDAYIGNSATGGLHIDRIVGCPGVGHLNTKLIDSDEHIRRRTKLVDKAYIKDRPEDASLRMDFISYSLDWRVVYDELMTIINGR